MTRGGSARDRGADSVMGFVGVRSCAPELARILLSPPITGHALRQASAQERTPPKPLDGFRPPDPGLSRGGGRGKGGAIGAGAFAGVARIESVGAEEAWTLTVGARRPPGKGRWDLLGIEAMGLWKRVRSVRLWAVAAVLLLAAGVRAEGNFGATENESGGYGEWHESPVKKDSAVKAARAKAKKRPARAEAKTVDSLDLETVAGQAAKESGDAKGRKGALPDSGLAGSAGGVKPDSAVASGGKPDSGAGDSAVGSAGPDAAVPGVQVIAPAAQPEPMAEVAGAPTVMLLPMTVPKGTAGDSGRFEEVETALRLGLEQSRRFRVWTAEEAAHGYGGAEPPKGCFADKCLQTAVRKTGSALVVASQYSLRDSVTVLKLVLAEAPGGRMRRAVQVWGRPGRGGLIPFAREAALLLAIPDRDPAEAKSAGGIDGAFFASRPWANVPWLNPKDTVDNRRRWGWAGSGVLAVGLGLAYAQGHLLQEDGNHSQLAKDVLSGSGAPSYLRGFFAAPTLGARYAALGGAGIAQVGDGLALLMNPAGVAQADRENVVAAKRSLPDGTPSLFLAYAGPLYPHWSQGLGVQFEGDRLANETTLHGALGYDLGALAKELEGIKAGVQTKIYLARVGEAGTGEDRSTGRSFGMGLDLGLQARLNDRITAALAVRDVASFLRHNNTLTNQAYGEVLPPEYRIGAVYRASNSLLLLMDGQKGIWADQVDHLRLGGEQVLFDFLALRCGLHEIFGREAVRKLTLGFGLNTDALGDNAFKVKMSVNYAYEFGLGEDEPLGAGQQFSLDASF